MNMFVNESIYKIIMLSCNYTSKVVKRDFMG